MASRTGRCGTRATLDTAEAARSSTFSFVVRALQPAAAMPTMTDLLREAAERQASDLHLSSGEPPFLRVHGDLTRTESAALDPATVLTLVHSIMTPAQRERYAAEHEIDFATQLDGLGRYRVNAFQHGRGPGVVLRTIPTVVPSLDTMEFPPILKELCTRERGLILVTGPTGSGKSTTLAAMVDQINQTRRVNIVTIEDPIEMVHQDRLSLIHQREVGEDTGGFAEALRRVLRQDPDVILIGEMRDRPTIDAALKAGETGHLVLSTLHTLDAAETINRVLDFYPGGLQRRVRLTLASTLRGIISQRLLPRADGSGRVVAAEVLVNTERVSERISDPELTVEIPDVIAQGSYYGMETFDQSILRLFAAGTITFAEGLRHATKPADLRLRAQQLGLIPT